jgi:tryptophan synthase alpha chain
MKKVIAYITAGYPSPQFTIDLLGRLAEVGVDGVELGIPFSDPVADGPVIQEVNKRALERGFRVKELFEIGEATKNLPLDRYLMGYFNIFYHNGYDKFAQRAEATGFKGFIIPDLPFEEAEEYADIFPLIPFVAPTDSPERIAKILTKGREFIYLVAYAGITGANKEEELEEVIGEIRRNSPLPLYLGFGVTPENADKKARLVDGVIVGTALVKELLKDDLSPSQQLENIVQKARIIKEKVAEVL